MVKISDGLSYKNFRFTMNHPLDRQIIESLGEELSDEGAFIKPSSTLRIGHVVLPYQSFEISWKID